MIWLMDLKRLNQYMIKHNKIKAGLEKWRNDRSVDQDLRRLYKRLYHFAEIIDASLKGKIELKEFMTKPEKV